MNHKQKRICRLCLKKAVRNSAIIGDSIKGILSVLQLKIDLNVTKTPIICKRCMELLEGYSNFTINCWYVEEKIKEFCRIAGTDRYGQVELSNVNEFISRNKLERDRVCNQVKVEVIEIEENEFISKNKLEGDRMCNQPVELIEIEENSCEDGELEVQVNCENEVKLEEPDLDELNLDIKEEKTDENVDDIKPDRIAGTDRYGQVELNNINEFISKNKLEGDRMCNQVKVEIIEIEESEFISKNILEGDRVCNQAKVDVIEIEENSREGGEFEVQVKCENEVKLEESDLEELNLDIKEEKTEENIDYSKPDSFKDIPSQLEEPKQPLALEDTRGTIHSCEVCEYKTKNKNSLNRHMLIHIDESEETLYQCEICSYKTKWTSHFKDHVMMHKNISEVPYKCDTCSFEAKCEYDVKQHVLVHRDASVLKVYQCELCECKTQVKNTLNQQMMEHASELKYRCEICNHTTNYNSNLRKHMLVHKDPSEIKMFECYLCGYKTKMKQTLKRHIMATHGYGSKKTQKTVYKCKLCFFETKLKTTIIKHLRKHKHPRVKDANMVC